MADNKIVPFGHNPEVVRKYIESSRHGHGEQWLTDRLAEPRGLEARHVSVEDGQAFFQVNGSDMTEINEWTDGLRVVKNFLEERGVTVVYGGAVFVPGVTATGVPVTCVRTIDEILASGENGLVIGTISIELFTVGRPLPPGLVPRLLKAAESICEAEVGENKEADTSAEGNPLGASLRCTRHVGMF